ncbi:MAG: DUF4397 domain-containing protein, partial [Gammaproteobacteria bacterium]
SFDADTYDFHFDIVPAGSVTERAVSFTYELVPETDYTIVATEIGGQFQQLILEAPSFDFDSASAQVASLHVAATLGAVDVFVEAPGTDLLSAVPLGTLSFSENLAPGTIGAGDYEFTLTAAASPANVLLRSTPFTLAAGQAALFAIIDGANEGLAPISVTVSGGTNFSLVDRGLLSGIRVINAISDRSALDVGIDNEFSPPLFPGLIFDTVSAYDETVAPGTHDLTARRAANPGVSEVDFPFAVDAGRLGTFFIANAPGATATSFSVDDYRPITGEAKISLYNAAQLFAFVDIFIALSGTDLNTVPPIASLLPGTSFPGIRIAEGGFDLTVREGGTQTVLAGPTPITLNAGGFYGILVTDSLSATVDLSLLDDFP